MKLYAWGANSSGQLGLGQKCEAVLEPTEVDLSNCGLQPENIVCIAGGSGHALILDNNGHIYCCGLNTKGQLGISDSNGRFEEIEILNGRKIAHVACGWDFSAALSDNGRLFVWGDNSYTQLGLSKSITCTGIPSMLQVSQKLATGFSHISCGLRHSAMITKDQCLLVAGSGLKGQLGLGDNISDDNYLSISKVPDLKDVESVACGQNHTIVLTANGTLLSWGENKFGQLAIDPETKNSFVPSEVLTNESFEKVFSGWTHSAALTKTGEIFVWGRNNYGQLGFQKTVAHKPEKIPNFKDVKQLSLGSEHSLAVTKDGKLFSWGWNEHGSCGTGDTNNVMKPTQVLVNRKVKLAFACTGQSFAVVE
ncbi:secretion-regulating guanine nucleotide exchange factor [Onthophagus taurus]|uniref:secretion-regulating guanine nucleotide exchange factor n=1 Tax=Onthophagus taurus TaxID=166361 RepID=UPI000C20C200|nr:secretion-regulating guanine nucleotide exchange factor [Onthophagus taurus]